MVKKIAQESNAELITFSGQDVYGKYIGDSEKKLREYFSLASVVEGPSIIFIDEIVRLFFAFIHKILKILGEKKTRMLYVHQEKMGMLMNQELWLNYLPLWMVLCKGRQL